MEWLKAFIPQHFSNAQVLGFLDICTRFRISKRRIADNHKANQKICANASALNGAFYKQGNYIENQRQWSLVKFGRYTMDYSGCEIIATYNALLSLGTKMSEHEIADLIRIYERSGAALWGGWGVAPKAIYRFFQNRGYDTAITCSTEQKDMDAMEKLYSTIILTLYNDARDITKQIHTMNVSKNGEHHFILHNCYRTDGNGVYVGKACGSLYGAVKSIHGGRAKPICIIGVNAVSSPR